MRLIRQHNLDITMGKARNSLPGEIQAGTKECRGDRKFYQALRRRLRGQNWITAMKSNLSSVLGLELDKGLASPLEKKGRGCPGLWKEPEQEKTAWLALDKSLSLLVQSEARGRLKMVWEALWSPPVQGRGLKLRSPWLSPS